MPQRYKFFAIISYLCLKKSYTTYYYAPTINPAYVHISNSCATNL